ncbi:TrkA C-terminal domain-containing protein [Leptolyngbya sp. CCNP1308]|uniref:TrkA C-terminal domain-containing protein n=1 Tax=Leptolyngbya sp. CCNP1308 TaxID=3110255 RepID=UPI002B2168F3|nr:TrkA C-terminal domain-containing protein [Leptolyngbya sp. CCNP1308]MEA5451104.1 TrkA C-terminal domain-containing protein [Leptolyngbya sp. CCNP1308]
MKPSSSIHQVYFNSAFLGAKLSEVTLPERCFLLGLVRENQVYSLADNPEILEKDWLVAVALDEALMPELDLCLRQVKQTNAD